MDFRKLKPPLSFSILVLFAAILGSLHLMSSATQDSSQLGRLFSLLLLINGLSSVLLLGLVGVNVYWLLRQLKHKAAGSLLTARMVFLFILLALAPSTIVFYYSMQFLQRNIDSWFDVRIDHAMDDAMELGRSALDERMQSLLKQSEQLAWHFENVPASMVGITLGEVYERTDDSEVTVFTKKGNIVASGGASSVEIVPDLPSETVLLQLRQGKSYVGLEPTGGSGMKMRAVVVVNGRDENFFLQTVLPVPQRLAELALSVESAHAHYKELNYLRSSLKASFTLTLSLILLLSLLAAIWTAFISIRNIVAPVRRLAEGTRAVAEGDYEKRLPVRSKDELGFLVESFNIMTAKIARARDEAQNSRQEVERQRAYLETVLGNLSSAVVSFDSHLRLQTANPAAETILHAHFSNLHNIPLPEMAEHYPHLGELMKFVGELMLKEKPWEKEVHFNGPKGGQELFCRGTPLSDSEGRQQGTVVVFDDVTALIQAQRRAAWGEVAQRLAHEIKNPLTPIQLSAERLQHKLTKSLDEAGAEVLEKSTRTIVQQVEAMKSMVNAFAEYAKPSIINLQTVDLNQLIEEVVALYPPQCGLVFQMALDRLGPKIMADPVRLRQVLHNMVKNAQEAITPETEGIMLISTLLTQDHGIPTVEILLRDNGPGIPPEQAEKIFDPYVTTKNKGTGLGLAIVKKIIEEHGGSIRLDMNQEAGAGFIIRLPLADGLGEGVKHG